MNKSSDKNSAKTPWSTKRLKAFSLVEVSIVILIIGLMMAGVTAGSILTKKTRISTAQNLTNASTVNTIREVNLWLETSLDRSFSSDFEANNNAPLTGSSWSNISQNNNSPITLSVAGTGDDVIYSNTINHIPAIKFSAGKYLTFDGSFLNNTNYSIVVLDKRLTASDDNYFIGDSTNTDDNESLLLGYSETAEVIHSQSGSASDSSYASSIDSYANSNGKARIFTFTHSQTEGNKTYINGYLAKTDATLTTHLSNISTLQLGQGYSGEIGEVIFFTKAIRNDERRDIEKYLTKKFKVADSISLSLTDDNTELEGCDGGQISGSGCLQTCSVSETGISTPSTVEAGSGSLTCNDTNFTGSINYTCTNGVFATEDSCSCDTGYELSGTECVIGLEDACSGGIKTTFGTNVLFAFKSSGTFTCTREITGAKILVVAGGGGGAKTGGGGGGAGGVVYNSNFTLGNTSYNITAGSGGAPSNHYTINGDNGEDSEFSTDIIAIGGGGGGNGNVSSHSGSNGGSGGGLGIYGYQGGAVPGSSMAGTGGTSYGNAGGEVDAYGRGSGGGGAGSIGESPHTKNGSGYNTIPGNGGAGIDFSATFGTTYGESGWFAGGGGGGTDDPGVTSDGGQGGGGDLDSAGTANTGGGGGGGLSNPGAGGSGIVLILYDTQ